MIPVADLPMEIMSRFQSGHFEIVFAFSKSALRPAQGVFRGLYVFSLLRWIWQQTLRSTSASEASHLPRKRKIFTAVIRELCD